MPDPSIIVVGTNERHWLKPCLNSVFKQTTGSEFEVIVVDNASTDGTGEMIAAEFPRVKVIRNDHNYGFASANNRAIRVATGNYVLLLNPDTEVLDGAIQKTIRFMEVHPKSGLVGCRLKYPNGQFQSTAYSFPTVWNALSEATFLYKLFPRTKLFGQYHLSYLDYDHDVQVDWLIGAYFLIRREVIAKIGLLDEQFYMYTEDTDYCYRVKQAGYEVWFTASGEVTHFYGGMNAFDKRVTILVQRSQVLFYQKHYHFAKKIMLLLIKHLGLALRVVWYFAAGIASMNKKLLNKSLYAGYAIFRLLTTRWKYVTG